MAKVAVVDYGMGNLRSVSQAVLHVAAGSGVDVVVTQSPQDVLAADRVVLPGQGAMRDCMRALGESGLQDAVLHAATHKPLLGVCVGMQMLFDGSDESPDHPGLGVLPGRVTLLPEGVKRPQMQWNVLDWAPGTAMASGQPDPTWAYFVHSYWAEVADPADVAATCHYGTAVTAAIQHERLWATQFHPEKSAHNGLRLLEAFVESLG